jgi:putative hydrolase of the HAD superfamily
VRAVIFDLWDTLVDWSPEEGLRLTETLAALAGAPVDEFERRLRASYRPLQTGPLAAVYRELGIPEEDLATAVQAHHDLARRTLRLRTGAARALARLRTCGLKLGLISVCSEDVPARFPATDLAGLFDVETFSSECGLMKPEPEIYLLTARALGVDPGECMFVGDGANDELAGAERVGMQPVLFLPEDTSPRWPEVREWQGLRVSSIEEVSRLCS